jgi:hypothetical protein
VRPLILALLALVLACRPAGGGRQQAQEPPAPTPRPQPIGRPAPPPSRSQAAAGPRVAEFWYWEALTRDGTQALLRQTPQRYGPGGSRTAPPRLRLVDVDRGTVLEEVALEQLATLPLETISDGGRVLHTVDAALRAPALASELATVAKLAERFPLGALDRFAAAPGARRIAFNAGDWIYVSDTTGGAARRVSPRASYSPWFTPDGRRLLFRRIGPTLDGVVSRYDVHVVPADLRAPPRIVAGTGETHEPFVLSADGREAIVLAGNTPKLKLCAIAIPLAPPHAVRRLACLDGDERLVDHHLSPTGCWLDVTTGRETSEDDPNNFSIGRDGVKRPVKKTAYRRRVFRLADAKVVVDEQRPGRSLAISDEGLALLRLLDGNLALVDANGRPERLLPRSQLPDVGFQVRFRGPREVLYVDDGMVRRVALPPSEPAP